MILFLQLWGGLFYLINKILFSLAENLSFSLRRRFRIVSWILYILGVPAWVVILVLKHNWIAASIEAGGIPAMIFGLSKDLRPKSTASRRLDLLASGFTYLFIILGVGYSFMDFGGIRSLSQVLEILVTIGFLAGSYFMAKGRSAGWLFFMLMNGSMGYLMYIQGHPLLTLQQVISFCFVVYGYTTVLRTSSGNCGIPEKAGPDN